MKRILSISAVALIIATGFSSCAKCEICTKSSAPEMRICEGDYGSTTEWGVALDALEAQGYNCR